MLVQSLGYVGLRAKDIEDWSGYGTRLLGLQAVDRSRRRSRSAWTTASSGSSSMPTAARASASSAGRWRTPRRSTRLGAHLEPHGIEVARGVARARRGTARRRSAGGSTIPWATGWSSSTAPRSRRDPFVPGRNISGFRTGALGLGHVVLHVERIEEMMAFYRDILGFRAQRLFPAPVSALLLPREPAPPQHRVRRHRQECGASHDAGAVQPRRRRPGLRPRRPAKREETSRLAVTLGRHCGDCVTSFYTWNPSGLHDRVRLGRPRHRSRQPGSRPSARKARASGATTAPG